MACVKYLTGNTSALDHRPGSSLSSSSSASSSSSSSSSSSPRGPARGSVQWKRLQHMEKIVQSIDQYPQSWPFRYPVDAEALNVPDYYTIIKHPMDLSTIYKKLKSNQYKSAEECISDFRLIFSNCYSFNFSHDLVYQCGKNCEILFVKKLKKLPSAEAKVPKKRGRKRKQSQEKEITSKKTKMDSGKGMTSKQTKMDSEKEMASKKTKMDSEKTMTSKKTTMDSEKEMASKKTKMDSEKEMASKKTKMDSEKEMASKKTKMDSEKEMTSKKTKMESEKEMTSEQMKMADSENETRLKKIIFGSEKREKTDDDIMIVKCSDKEDLVLRKIMALTARANEIAQELQAVTNLHIQKAKEKRLRKQLLEKKKSDGETEREREGESGKESETESDSGRDSEKEREREREISCGVKMK